MLFEGWKRQVAGKQHQVSFVRASSANATLTDATRSAAVGFTRRTNPAVVSGVKYPTDATCTFEYGVDYYGGDISSATTNSREHACAMGVRVLLALAVVGGKGWPCAGSHDHQAETGPVLQLESAARPAPLSTGAFTGHSTQQMVVAG